VAILIEGQQRWVFGISGIEKSWTLVADILRPIPAVLLF
jgi:hypothetical protein